MSHEHACSKTATIQMERARLSRRQLLATTGAGLAAGAAAGALRPFRAGALDATPVDVPATWDYQADVVIVGYGGAGTTAAIEAVQAGAEVLCLEKAETAGGNTAHSGGIVYLGGGTALQQAHGFDDTPENMYAYLEAQMGPTNDPEMIQVYCERSVEHFDWLVAQGVEFGQEFWPGKVVSPPGESGGLSFSGGETDYPFADIAEPMPRGHTPPGAGPAVYQPLGAVAEEVGVQALFNAPAERLVMNAEGRVVGVIARVDGQEQTVLARRGVVLSAGGFQFNEKMLAQHAPWYLIGIPLGAPHEGDDGSGIKMGQAVGAEAVNLSFGSPWKFVYPPSARCKGILIDGRGMRFVNECAYGQNIGDAIIRKNAGIGWLIVDQHVADEMAEADQPLAEPAATGDTIEELATQLDVPPEVLANTVAFYNEQAAQGEDPLWHKGADYLQPLTTPPFMAADFGEASGLPFITLGGLRIDTEGQVRNAFGEVIPGLYSAGRNGPGISVEFYVSGSAVGDCTFWGRVAGRPAAAASPWTNG